MTELDDMMRERTGLMAANALIAAIAIASYLDMTAIHPMYPLNGAVIDERRPVFGWSGPSVGYEIFIDEDSAFATPMRFSTTSGAFVPDEDLDFGTYWWKVRSGSSESMPRAFTIVSTVALARPSGTRVVNAGNTALLLGRGLTGAVTLGVGEDIEIEEEENVTAEQI
jgi:hypothetical protein